MSEISVEITDGHRDLPICRQTVMDVAAGMGFTGNDLDDIVSAVFEACVNAVTYGRNKTDESVVVQIHTHPDHFEAIVKDTGTGFRYPDDNPPHTSSRGRGIPLMKEFMDEVRFEYDNGCIVTLIKYLNRD